MISFEEARRIVRQKNARTWARNYRGTYMVADYGFENDSTWMLIDGARESVMDDDPAFEPVGRGSTCVDKSTGQVFFRHYHADREWFDAMTEVGQHPEKPE